MHSSTKMTIWKFICYLIYEKQEPNINIVRERENALIFRVNAPNQKIFKTNEEKDRAWSVILKYAKLIGKKKPVGAKKYTDRRQTFFSGIVKMTRKDGVVRRLQKSELIKLGIDREDGYVYFLYEGSKIPTQGGSFLDHVGCNMVPDDNGVGIMPVDLVVDIAQTNVPKNANDIEEMISEPFSNNETRTATNDPELCHIFTYHEDPIEYNDQWLNNVWLNDINNKAEEKEEEDLCFRQN